MEKKYGNKIIMIKRYKTMDTIKNLFISRFYFIHGIGNSKLIKQYLDQICFNTVCSCYSRETMRDLGKVRITLL